MNSAISKPSLETTANSLPSAAVRFEEISDNDELLAIVWRWYGRDPTFDPHSHRSRGADDVTGHEWVHFCFFVNDKPRVGVSLEERQPGGFEVHVASAPGCAPALVRAALRFVGDAAFASGAERVIAWIPVEHRAAGRLAAEFLRSECVLQDEEDNRSWHRLAISQQQWNDTYTYERPES